MNNSYSDIENYLKHISVMENGVGTEREKELSRIIKCSNSLDAKHKAIEELVNGNLGLVLKCAKDIYRIYHANSSLMDLVTEGNYWLFYAAKRFSYRKDCRFSTYVCPIIRWKMIDFIRSNSLIHIPLNLLKYQKRFKELQNRFGDELTREILMEELNISNAEADNINIAFKLKISSLDDKMDNDQSTSLNDIIEDEMVPNPSFEADKTTLKEYIDEIGNKCLNAREKQIIKLMFYTDDKIFFRDIAKQLNVSGERARQLYINAIRKLKNKFIDEWDCKYAEDRIDKGKLYRETTGKDDYCLVHRMRQQYDNVFIKRLNKKYEEKTKKIWHDLI